METSAPATRKSVSTVRGFHLGNCWSWLWWPRESPVLWDCQGMKKQKGHPDLTRSSRDGEVKQPTDLFIFNHIDLFDQDIDSKPLMLFLDACSCPSKIYQNDNMLIWLRKKTLQEKSGGKSGVCITAVWENCINGVGSVFGSLHKVLWYKISGLT